MKIKVTFTSDDALGDALCQAAESACENFDGATPMELALAQENEAENLYVKLRRWLNDSDEIAIEFDLEAGTARVLERP